MNADSPTVNLDRIYRIDKISEILFIMSILSQKHIAVTSAAVTGKIDVPG